MRTLKHSDIDMIRLHCEGKSKWYVDKMVEYVKKYGDDGNKFYDDIEMAETMLEEKSFEQGEQDEN